MSKVYEVADALYEHIEKAANDLADASSYEAQTGGLEHLANAYAKVVEADKRKHVPN